MQHCVSLEKLPTLIEVLNELRNNTTLKEKKEATASIINKLLDDLLEEKRLVENDEGIQNQTTEA
ncbi:hypothetical protein COJ37_11930 [Bacillus cereus]|nr:hypothetical protein [Bacillus thuringiensis]PFF54104.1 hypothetical protein CN334_29015 [Bacillus thuringiensis]PFM01442.1 hypothetical protein COJ37_11930 [Bacillus cereus]PGL88434.1 hypothetical protein CN943_32125 [Bacillus thuringiensis]